MLFNLSEGNSIRRAAPGGIGSPAGWDEWVLAIPADIAHGHAPLPQQGPRPVLRCDPGDPLPRKAQLALVIRGARPDQPGDDKPPQQAAQQQTAGHPAERESPGPREETPLGHSPFSGLLQQRAPGLGIAPVPRHGTTPGLHEFGVVPYLGEPHIAFPPGERGGEKRREPPLDPPTRLHTLERSPAFQQHADHLAPQAEQFLQVGGAQHALQFDGRFPCRQSVAESPHHADRAFKLPLAGADSPEQFAGRPLEPLGQIVATKGGQVERG